MNAPRLSFEFFPPKSERQRARFWRAFGALEHLTPDFVSVTWGAQGSDSEASVALLEELVAETSVPVLAHLTCAGQTRIEVLRTLDRLEQLGISRILALRGDDMPSYASPGTLRHATDLLEIIVERGGFQTSVSAYPEVHPEARSAADDLHWLRRKAELGATRAITQFFFEPEPFLRLRDALGDGAQKMALVPGILPVHDIDAVVSFAAKCGSRVPGWLRERFAGVDDAAIRRRIAVEQATALCEALVREGVEQLHLYTLNRAGLAGEVAQRLGRGPGRGAGSGAGVNRSGSWSSAA